jgi:3-dehydroquinate synthase
MATKITANLGERSYPVYTGAGALKHLPPEVRKLAGANRVFVLYDAQLYALHGHTIDRLLRQSGRPMVELVIPSGEKSKSRASLNRIHDFLFASAISRTDIIVAVGGGVISDLVGYAAATALRGVPWGIVSTTLLGMVDAAIGGKTGINHPTGKNLIGAFWQPRFVICDPSLLYTLALRQLVAGLGEVIKYAGLTGQEMNILVESYMKKGDLYDQRFLGRIIRASVACKANIVARDETDSGVRRWLNLGHTFAHAIEASLGYGKLLHGEAVLIGLAAAIELSKLARVGTEKRLGPYGDMVVRCLTLLPRRKIYRDEVMAAMHMDKKRDGKRMNFVLLERPGKPLIRAGIKPTQVRAALDRTLELYELHGGSNAAAAGR